MTDFKTKPCLHGKKVLLRPFQAADINPMLRILEESEINHLTGSVHTSEQAQRAMSAAERARSIAWYESRNEQDDRLDLAIVDAASGQLVGEAVLNEFDEENLCCNFRILIGAAGRGLGLGSEATTLMVEYAFSVLHLHRLELSVFAFNPRAQHVYEKAGFVHEGTRRGAFCYDGAWYDELLYSILAQEYASFA